MYLKSKTSKSKTHKVVRENINLNKNNGIQILSPEHMYNWFEQLSELKKDQGAYQQRALTKTKLIIKWWEN